MDTVPRRSNFSPESNVYFLYKGKGILAGLPCPLLGAAAPFLVFLGVISQINYLHPTPRL